MDTQVLLACLSNLSVRNEYCQTVVEAGVLASLLTLLVDPDQHKEIVRESLNLLKTLSGNDNVKKDIAASKGIPIIINIMEKNLVNLFLFV